MKPLCDLCGTRHESYQAHVFAKPVANTWITALDNAGSKTYRYRDPEKRRKQMAEVMRKRRARLRAAKAA